MEGKNAVVTGSTTGIGLGIAHELASKGCNIILTGLGEQSVIDNLVKDFKRKYESITVNFIPCNLTRPDEIRTFCNQVAGIFPNGVDILVNNAGIQFTTLIEDYPLETWNTMMAIGLTAPYLLIQKFLPKMKSNDTNCGAYDGRFCIKFHKGVALESAPFSVTCNAICPGYSDAPIFYHKVEKHAVANSMSFDEAKKELFSTLNPHKKPITVSEIAELVIFLCSSGADSMTGSAIMMDAGNTAK